MYCPYNVKHKVAARMEAVGGQLMDWNFELRGVQSWCCDEERWKYDEVKVSDAEPGLYLSYLGGRLKICRKKE